jgi:lipoprotein-releasing system ATP-binding protein
MSEPSPAPTASSAPPGLQVADLVKEYPTRAEPLRVLDGVGLSLAAGESLAVMGPSGSGKSTLLNVLGTLERPTAGTVRLAGDDPFALDEAALAAFRAKRIGFVFQEHRLLPQLSVLENALLPALALGGAGAEITDRVRGLLERVGLGKRLSHRPAELSGGERQRTAIVRALANRPGLLLADEPTGNLDRKTAESVADLLRELHAEERSLLIVVTHSADLARRFPKRMEMADGKLREMAGV